MRAAKPGRGLRIFVLAAVLGGLVAPILAGLWYTAQAAFGGLAGGAPASWATLAALPGLKTSVALSLWTGLAATGLSLALAFALIVEWHTRGARTRGLYLLTPLLAAPHSAVAIGLAFLLAPSGWIVRLFSPWATGWTVPPDLATVQDPLGLALIIGLVVKETPFLLLVTAAALRQVPVRQHLAAGQSLGYAPRQVWIRILLPELYRLIRLPVYVVLAFSLSVVDMAIILGPSNPPTLAVAMTRWYAAADLQRFAPASSAALLLGVVTIGAAILWTAGSRFAARLLAATFYQGRRRGPVRGPQLCAALGVVVLLSGAGALLASVIWSLARQWRFPADLPSDWTVSAWTTHSAVWVRSVTETALLAGVASGLSLLLAILWLEGETRGHFARARWAEALIYLPLLIPQLAFLFGLHIVFLRLGVGGDRMSVIWVHVIFVFPYVMLALSEPWRALDPRLTRTAAALGASPLRQLLAIRLPCLTGPILTALAIGVAVSTAQYLPTLFMGGGRIRTLTTEAVSLASGGDRRATGVFAVLQSALPLLAYGLAVTLPALLLRNRRGLSGGGA